MSANLGLNHPGIYTITCTANGRVYVGQAVNFRKRWSFHRWRLSKGEHDNAHLQNAWKKYGPEAFVFAIAVDLRAYPKEHLFDALNEHERAVLSATPNAFNLTEAAIGTHRFSAETRAKLSADRKARWADPEYRARVQSSMLSKAQDAEFQERRGAAIKAGKSAIKAGKSTPERRSKAGAESAARWADPAFKAARSAERKVLWSDPVYRAQQTEARKAAWVKRRAKAAGIPT